MSSSVKTLLIGKCFGIKFYICSPPWQRSIFSLTGVCVFLSKVSVFSALPTEECFKFSISTYLSVALGFKEVLESGLTSYLKGILPPKKQPLMGFVCKGCGASVVRREEGWLHAQSGTTQGSWKTVSNVWSPDISTICYCSVSAFSHVVLFHWSHQQIQTYCPG